MEVDGDAPPLLPTPCIGDQKRQGQGSLEGIHCHCRGNGLSGQGRAGETAGMGLGGPLGTPSRQDAACGTGNKTRDVGLRGMRFLFRQTQLLNLPGNAGRKEGDQAEQPLGTPSWVGQGHTGSHTPTVVSGRKVGPPNSPSTLFLPRHLSWRSLRQVGWGGGRRKRKRRRPDQLRLSTS